MWDRAQREDLEVRGTEELLGLSDTAEEKGLNVGIDFLLEERLKGIRDHPQGVKSGEKEENSLWQWKVSQQSNSKRHAGYALHAAY